MKKPTPKRTSRNSSSAKKAGAKQRKNTGRANLGKPWQPGQSGNPSGRPKKGMAISDAMRDILAGCEMSVTLRQPRKKAITYEVTTDKNFAYAVGAAAIYRAIKGDVFAIKEVCDRVQGKAHQSIGIAPTAGPETPVPDDILAEMADRLRERGEA